MTEFLRLLLEKERVPKVQAAICIGFAKLMLSGMVTDEEVSSYMKSLSRCSSESRMERS